MTQPPPYYYFCLARACGESTDGGKPFCEDHVERMRYVQDIHACTERKEREAQALKAGKPAKPRGALAAEVLIVLRGRGPLSAASVAWAVREFKRDSSLALRVLEALATRRRGGVRRTAVDGLWEAT